MFWKGNQNIGFPMVARFWHSSTASERDFCNWPNCHFEMETKRLAVQSWLAFGIPLLLQIKNFYNWPSIYFVMGSRHQGIQCWFDFGNIVLFQSKIFFIFGPIAILKWKSLFWLFKSGSILASQFCFRKSFSINVLFAILKKELQFWLFNSGLISASQ